jgi:hypothetical protein
MSPAFLLCAMQHQASNQPQQQHVSLPSPALVACAIQNAPLLLMCPLQEHYDTAIYHFAQLLERNPCHWGALSQLIILLRRAGRLEDVPK